MPPTKKFVPRQRKHKVLARQTREHNGEGSVTGPSAATPVDSNRTEILPEEVRERNAKKERLREELRSGQPQMSAKKAKRLEKYIETKLRKDENRELYERLAAKSIDTSLFESSKNLGQGKRRRNADRKKKEMQARDGDSESSDGSDDESLSESEEDVPIRKGPIERPVPQQAPPRETIEEPQKVEPVAQTTTSSLFGSQPVIPVIGSGLKRPLELGEDGRPVLQKRQKRGGVKSKYTVEQVHDHVEVIAQKVDEDDEWNGFSGDEEEEKEEDGKEDEEMKEDEADASTDDSDSESESDSDDSSDDDSQPAMSGFKAWAQQQRNDALGFQPTTGTEMSAVLDVPRPENFKPRPVEEEPLPIELQPSGNTDRKVFNVAVTRSAEVETTRLALPVVAEEQQIMEAIHGNDVVVITGGTGSGKTTQVPQFLYEAGYGSPDSPTPGMIGVTQPRRVAAVSMSKRVAEELGDHGKAVAYQIRFEGTADKNTAIKFMTDGVLLRELTDDIVLSRYSAVIVDEAHERSINTDVLIGILSRVNTMRKDLNERNASSGGANAPKPLQPLKLIIMSATLQIEDLTLNKRLFPVPPRVVSVEGRQFPVTTHFSRVTRTDYVEEAFKKVVRGHRKLPPGSFLVFLTGEDEIQRLAKRLRLEINGMDTATGPKVRISARDVPFEPEDVDFGGGMEDEDQLSEGSRSDDDGEDGEGAEDTEFVVEDGEAGTGPLRMNVLPLFSKLPTREQQRVFQPAPEGYRQVILATNVAETSLTIPGVRYVFDCGRSKERKYNHVTGVQSFEVDWISKASANQRSGRAGRTGPGHCYRLYSSAMYEENFGEFADPEVLRIPIEGVVLQLKSMNVPNIDMFPFPTPPDRQSLAKAERLLKYIGALRPSGEITDAGKLMATFPLAPRFAKILLVGHVQNCMHYVIAMVAALSSAEDIFLSRNRAIPPGPTAEEEAAKLAKGYIRTQEDVRKEEQRRAASELFGKVHRQFSSTDEFSDALKLLHVVAEYLEASTDSWCRGHFVLHKPLREIQKMRRQITELLRANVPALSGLSFAEQLPPPTDAQVALLKQMVAAGFVENVAIRADTAPNLPADLYLGRNPRSAIEVPYLPLIPLNKSQTGSELVYIHPASSLARLTVSECPQYVVYSHLQRSSGSAAAVAAATATATATGSGHEDGPVKVPKIRMRALTDVTGKQLTALAKGTPLLSYGKPIKETFVSPDGREREVWVVPYLRAEDGAGGLGWPLPATKVRQRKVPGRGWEVLE